MNYYLLGLVSSFSLVNLTVNQWTFIWIIIASASYWTGKMLCTVVADKGQLMIRTGVSGWRCSSDISSPG